MIDLTSYSIYLVIGIVVFLILILIVRSIFRVNYQIKLMEFQFRALIAIAEKQGVDTRRIRYDFERATDRSDELPKKFEEATEGA